MRWIQERSQTNGGAWRFFISHPEIIAISHLQASNHIKMNPYTRRPEKIVDISDFRALMVQLFVVSILWVHFKKADDWQSEHELHDAYTGIITEDEFAMAVKTFCAAYGQSELSEDEIRGDYRSLDPENTGRVTFLQVSSSSCLLGTCSLCFDMNR